MQGRTMMLGLVALLPLLAVAEQPLERRGEKMVNGRSQPYVVRHLPVSAFPELPPLVRAELERRNCLIPQTYEAHRPENVIRGSFSAPAAADWAALCSTEGRVSLLVFFSDRPEAEELAVAEETDRLEVQASTGVMGFAWGIDAASPAQVHEAQAGLRPRPARLTHDALVDEWIDHRTVFRFFDGGKWRELPLPE